LRVRCLRCVRAAWSGSATFNSAYNKMLEIKHECNAHFIRCGIVLFENDLISPAKKPSICTYIIRAALIAFWML